MNFFYKKKWELLTSCSLLLFFGKQENKLQRIQSKIPKFLQMLSLALLLSFFSNAQVIVDRHINAYTLSKKIVKFQRDFNSKSISEADRKIKLQEFFGNLVWYADLQDYATQDTLASMLNQKLKSYINIHGFYNKFYIELNDRDSLLSISKEDFDTHYTTLNKEFVEKMSRVFKTLDSVKASIINHEKYQKTLLNRKSNQNELISQLTNDTLKIVDELKHNAELNLEVPENLNDSLSKIKEEIKSSVTKISKLNNELKDVKDKLDIANQKKQNIKIQLQKILDEHPSIKVDFWRIYNQYEANDFKSAGFNDEQVIATQINRIQQSHELIDKTNQDYSLKFKIPNQSDIIDAVAIYLAKRVKQESVMWFFETIRNSASQYDLVRTFFPETITLLQSNEVYEIPNLGSQWRYALSKDFVKMPKNVFQSKWFDDWFPNKNSQDSLVLEYLNAGFDISDLLMQRYNYRNLVKQMYLQLNSKNTNRLNKQLRPNDIFGLLYGFNEECYVIDQNKKNDSISYRLLHYEDLRLMNKDEIEIMLSLIDMKYGGIFKKIFGLVNSDFEVSIPQVNSIRSWLGTIETGVKQFQKIQYEFHQTQEDIKNGKKEDAVYNLFNMWESVNTLFDLVIPDSTVKPEWMKGVSNQSLKVKFYTKKGFEVYNQISLKNYAGAVNSVINILDSFFYHKGGEFSISKIDFEKRVWQNTQRNGKSISKMPYFLDKNKPKEKNDPISKDIVYVLKRNEITSSLLFEKERHAIQLVRKLAGFLNDVMLTNDSKNLSKVVESYALPPGSYKRKRNTWMSLDFNAYVGAYGGFEFARREIGEKSPVIKSKGWVYGVTAPIGISFSRTFGRKVKSKQIESIGIRNPDKIRIGKNKLFERSNSTFTVSASIIDIGAVVSYRFNNTKDSVLPQQVRWEQVLSPGIHLSYGLPKMPLVFGVGYQYTPQLRRIEEVQPDPKNRQLNANRFYFGMFFDLPLMNIWQQSSYGPKMKKTKTRNKK